MSTIYIFSNDTSPFVLSKLLFQNYEVKNVNFDTTNSESVIRQGLACTPARYMEHLLNSLGPASDDQPILILNPFISPDVMRWIEFFGELAEKRYDASQIQYISDLIDRPLGILIPNPRTQLPQLDLFWFRFLSLIDSTSDIDLLNATQSVKTNFLQLNCQINYFSHTANGFYLLRYQGIYRQMTQHALRYVNKHGTQNPKATAILPFHAGDLMFFVDAHEQTKNNFDKIVVSHEYADIPRRMKSSLELKIMREDSIGRGKNKDPHQTTHFNQEFEYFHQMILPYLEKDELFYYFRPVRRYSHCKFHLTDQFKNALSNEKVIPIREASLPAWPPLPSAKKKILLHFDGGWPLKIYPYALQLSLIQMLQNEGYEVTVITNVKDKYPCATFPFTHLEALEELILENDILVGMDSFPAHFSTHVLKHPTIHMFSSTQPENSDNRISERYNFATEGLDCCPCDAAAICPRYNKNSCSNFSHPEKILGLVKKMVLQNYGVSP